MRLEVNDEKLPPKTTTASFLRFFAHSLGRSDLQWFPIGLFERSEWSGWLREGRKRQVQCCIAALRFAQRYHLKEV